MMQRADCGSVSALPNVYRAAPLGGVKPCTNTKLRVIVDEGVEASSVLVKRFAQTLAPGQEVAWTYLSQQHRAIPDNLVVGRLLGPGAVLLTRDRVLHNQACDLGFRSYMLDEQGNLRRHKIPGIQAPKPLPAASRLGLT
jgi:hypothetical protein